MKKPTTKDKSAEENTTPLQKSDIQKNADQRIDQDFPGYPHNPSREKIVHPSTAIEKATANIPKKDVIDEDIAADKMQSSEHHTLQTEEQYSDGSANAFESTENAGIEEKDGSLRNKKKKSEPNY